MRPATTAIDNHCHVLDPRRPPVAGARYAPFEASWRDYAEHLAGLGVRRGVLITASAHGTDNAPTMAALREAGLDLRGIAVVDPWSVTDHDLAALDEAGVCGVRVQDRFAGGAPLDALVPLGERLAGVGWHLEVWTDVAEQLDRLPDAIRRCRIPVVIDHLGFFTEETPLRERAMHTMIELARDGDIWITVSGAYRLAPDGPPSDAGRRLAPRVHRLLEAVPDRLLWGTDWPYVAPPHGTPSRDDLLGELDEWFLGDRALLDQVTVYNNARCYGFSPDNPLED